jgi:hypothetical protein
MFSLQAGKFYEHPGKWGDQFDLAFELSTDNSLLCIFIQKESLPDRSPAEVFGIDIVHAVEFSKIGCFWLSLSGHLQSNFSSLPFGFLKSTPCFQGISCNH